MCPAGNRVATQTAVGDDQLLSPFDRKAKRCIQTVCLPVGDRIQGDTVQQDLPAAKFQCAVVHLDVCAGARDEDALGAQRHRAVAGKKDRLIDIAQITGALIVYLGKIADMLEPGSIHLEDCRREGNIRAIGCRALD